MVMQLFQTVGRGILGSSVVTDAENQDFVPIPEQYALYQSYYENRMYMRSGVFRDTRTGLPVTIRPVHNPVARVVDWYAGRLYPGTMTEDGLATASGKPNRFPYSEATDEAVRIAVQTAFMWGAAGFNIGLYVRTGATLGDVFAEVVSDVERKKVYPKLIHPRFVTDIEWNDTGDVTMYRLDIPMQDRQGKQYTWGKIVTKDTITTLMNDRPHGYDEQPAEQENPWGFVPAIWVQHRNVGGQHGDPAFKHAISKIDELNSIASEIDDYILRFTQQQVIISTDYPEQFNKAAQEASARARDSEVLSDFAASSESVRRRDVQKVAAVSGNLSGLRLIENMGLADAVPHFEKRLAEIEQDFPEITFNEKLLAMSSPSGVAVEALTRDPQYKLDEAAANYDAGIVKLGQMCISVAAQCIAGGIWDRPFTAAQERFAVFTPESYDRGDLNFSLQPRSLVEDTLDQRIAQASSIERINTVQALIWAGWSEDDARAQIAQNREAKAFESDLTGRALSAGSLFG